MKGNKWKKIGWLLMLVTLLLVVAACSSNGEESAGESGNNGNTGGTTNESTNESDSPEEVGYPDSLSYWVTLNGNAGATMVDYNGMVAYQVMEEITGTKVEFQHPPSGQETDQFSLMFSSGDLPDIVETGWLGTHVPGGPDNAINDGRILRLNELIEEHAPNLTRVLDENPEWLKMITSDEGNIYTFPFLRGDDLLLTVHGLALRQDWLDKLELDMPTTLDEWEVVLTAFKEQDPNGNGEADEIPFLLEMGQINFGHAFVGAFGITTGFYNDGGTIKYGPIQPEYKEFLTMLNRWYENGLIDQDYASSDAQLRDAKVSNNELGAYAMYAGSGVGRMNDLVRETTPEFQLMPAPYPKLNADADLPIGQQDPVFTGNGVAISANAENPEQIVKWLDFKYSEEGHMLFNFGVEGESYEMVDGKPIYTDIIMNNPDGLPPTQAMSMYFRAAFSGPFVQDPGYIEQYYESPEQQQALVSWTQTDTSKLMPPVTPTAEENSRFSSIMSEVNTHRDEMLDRFIMGSESLDNFDEFVDVLKSMGIEEAVEIQQAAFDRYQER